MDWLYAHNFVFANKFEILVQIEYEKDEKISYHLSVNVKNLSKIIVILVDVFLHFNQGPQIISGKMMQ